MHVAHNLFRIIVVIWLLLPLACNRSLRSPEESTVSGSEDLSISNPPDQVDTTASTQDELEEEEEEQQQVAPPTLAELEANIEWVPQPVVNALEERRKKEANSEPLVPLDQALELRNDSDENNRTILDALGRLPVDDSEVDYEASMVKRWRGDVLTTNPLFWRTAQEVELAHLFAFNMFGADIDQNTFARDAAIRTWSTRTDGLYDKLVLRDDLQWSDGHPITAHDVVFSYQACVDLKVMERQFRWVKAYDEHTLVFCHFRSSPLNALKLSFDRIIPKHIYAESIKEDPTLRDSEYHKQQESNPVAGGPYEVVKWERGKELILQRRENYFMHQGRQVRPKPYMKRIHFRVIPSGNSALQALRGGGVDVTRLYSNQWLERTNDPEFYIHNTRVQGVSLTSFSFVWNTSSVFFDDKRVRWAMAYAFDRKLMLENVFQGLAEPAAGPFHRDSWTAPTDYPEPIKQDLNQAKQLLDAAGWVDSDADGIRDKQIGSDVIPFRFSLICSQGAASKRICQMLADDLAQVGVACVVRPIDPQKLGQFKREHVFHALFTGWGSSTDPAFKQQHFQTGGVTNYAAFTSERVDQLFKNGGRETDREKRTEIYQELHRVLWEEQPHHWLLWDNSLYGFNKSLRGFQFSPQGPFNHDPGIQALWKAKAE